MIIQLTTTKEETNNILADVMNRNHFLQIAMIDAIGQITRILAWDTVDKRTKAKLERSLDVLDRALNDQKA